MAAFGHDSDGGLWTVTYLMNKIVSNLKVWSSEVQLIDDTLQLLVALVEKRERWSTRMPLINEKNLEFEC